MQIETLGVDALIPYARNSRTHSPEQVAQIAASIREFGFTNPVLIDADGGIIAGHGRVMGARQLGLAEVPCIRLGHLSEAQRRAYVIADNKLALNAGWDEDMLAKEMADLKDVNFDLSLTGFDADEINAMFASLQATKEGKVDPEAAPPTQPDAVSKMGDTWVLGQHRVRCGDSTSVTDWAALLSGELIDCVWTDPPYNVAYGDKAEFLNRGSTKSQRNTSRILNDDMDDASFRDFLAGFYGALFCHMRGGAPIYVAHAETERANFTAQFMGAGFKLSTCIIWRKNTLVLARSDFQYIHEPILYGWKPGAAHSWYGGRKQVTVNAWGDNGPVQRGEDGKWRIYTGDSVLVVDGEATIEEHPMSIVHAGKPKVNDVHPTMKPVALIEKCLKLSARPGDLVADAFGGSGSTLIAAEQMGMRARLMELSPNYVDVIVRRWQQFTGKTAVLESTGQPFPG